MNNSSTKDNPSSESININSHTAIANTCAAMMVSALVHPFDLVKTRLQVSRFSNGAIPTYHGSMHAFRHIFVNEGIRGLYRGLGATIVAGGVSWGMFRFLFDNIRFSMTDTAPSARLNLFSGIAAGAISTCFVHPLWLFKSRLEMLSLESKSAGWQQYSNSLDCARSIIKLEGIRGLYTGIRPALLLVPHAAIQAFFYEDFKTRISATKIQANFEKNLGSSSIASSASKIVIPSLPFIWGATSKLLAVIITYPAQVLRAHQQMQKSQSAKMGLMKMTKDIVKKDGVTGVYRGFSVHVQRACLYTGCLFLIYEKILENVSSASLR